MYIYIYTHIYGCIACSVICFARAPCVIYDMLCRVPAPPIIAQSVRILPNTYVSKCACCLCASAQTLI